MKSLVMKSIYAGLGLLGTGKETVEQLGRKLAKKADLSEKDGERIARHLRARSEKAVGALQKSLEAEVNKVVSALHAATGEVKRGKGKGRSPAARRKAAPAKKTMRGARPR